MTIKVYAHEILDNVGHMVSTNASVAFTSTIEPITKTNTSKLDNLIKRDNLAIASANPNQKDLFYLRSILVSTGWNLNDDVFLPDELYAARNTPEDKQFNFMHNEKDIIGHITANQLVNLDGTPIEDGVAILPEEFNILTDAVIYTGWSDPEQRARIEKIVAEILDNLWFVSMETSFSNFDYAMKDASGNVKIVAREEATAFLTKHLRAYGGTGVINGYTIGRALRDLVFSGKGLVDKPANPGSVIINTEDENDMEESVSHTRGEDMSQDLNKEIEQLKAELSAAKAAVESVATLKSRAETLELSLAEKDTVIASSVAEIATLKTSIATLEATLKTITEEKEAIAAKMAETDKKIKSEKRKASLTDAGVETSELDTTLVSLDAISDEAFDKVVSVMKKAKKDMPADKTMCSEETEETEANEVLDSAEVDKSKAAVTETETSDSKKDFHASASAWFNDHLPTAKKVK